MAPPINAPPSSPPTTPAAILSFSARAGAANALATNAVAAIAEQLCPWDLRSALEHEAFRTSHHLAANGSLKRPVLPAHAGRRFTRQPLGDCLVLKFQ